MDEKLPVARAATLYERTTMQDDYVMAYIEGVVNRAVDQQIYSIKIYFNFSDTIDVYVGNDTYRSNLFIKDRAELVEKLKKKYADDPSVRITFHAGTTCFTDVIIIDWSKPVKRRNSGRECLDGVLACMACMDVCVACAKLA